MLEAVFLMLPALTAVIYQELHCILVFLGSAVFCLAAGALLRGKKPENTTIFSAEGYVSVAFCWVALSLCGAIPLYFSGSQIRWMHCLKLYPDLPQQDRPYYWM